VVNRILMPQAPICAKVHVSGVTAMRVAFALLAISLIAPPSSAWAYEKYIPLGHSYSPEQSTLPPLNSELDRLNANVDIIESDVYNRELISKKFQNNVHQFMDDRAIRPNSSFIDY
jgi:hypothetical protein